ncbi:ribonuclease E/G [Pelobacter propionicus]|uniref:Ribonuclease G n=1 Tax=Pelobacter propionicus (strain DSM 2379 / NBRC 103807 / OttBd1) TaxID=338966 RepID=A1ATE0_PELPD|nr:Rne/Rng family ribonuclease [Pelobacter propionicus]ABL00611.1 RNAse E [Pelobacter propionicus DSM 2379]
MSKAVSKKMLINVMHPEEARVAIVHDGRLMELNIEISGKEQTKGNIYKGVVLRVEPGLQAAFVDIGRPKPGFLQMGELHPDFWQWRDDVPEEQRKRRPRIQEVLRRGQELVVQVEKDERDNKGSALTSYLSLPGRYMVLMPGSDSSGISRKVEQESVRKQLKEIMAGMSIPEGIGYIVRTQAVGRTPEELQKDMENLLAMYEGIKKSATEIKGAGEIYRDKGLIIRFIRDYFSDDIDEVVVDSKEAFNEARDFFRETMPGCEKLVKLHKEKRPVFSRFQIEEQIDQIYEKRVSLPSGGSLIIEPTEALVSIDVNSGKSSGERGIEDTAFKTNMEAAEEVARQLRLRDLGGLIMIDFIDMRDRKHNHEVEKTLKQALKMDKARVNLGRISEFGILEMSRQRIAKTLNDAIHLACPHCEGRGKVKSVEAMALSFLRKVHGAAAKGNVCEVHGGLPLEVAYYLLNRKKRELAQIENDYDIEVTVKGKTSFLLNQMELEIVKREKKRPEEPARDDADNGEATQPALAVETVAAVPQEGEPSPENGATEGGKKRKRRRKKKKSATEGTAIPGQTEAESATEQSEEEHPLDQAPGEPTAARQAEEHEVPGAPAEEQTDEVTTEPTEEGEAAAAPKKRRRRRSRKVSKGAEESATAEESDETASAAEPLEVAPAELAAPAEPPAGETATEQPQAPETVPLETRSFESGPQEEPAVETTAVVAAAGPTAVETTPEEESTTQEAVAAETATAEAALKQLAPPEETSGEIVAPELLTAELLPEQPETPEPAAKPKRARAPRARKKTVATEEQQAVATTEAVPESAPAEAEPAVKKPRRRTAAKKSTPAADTTAEPVTEAPKPAPRKRRTKKDEQNQ